MSNNIKTHQVLDLHYSPEEGQGCFDGTEQECYEWMNTQSPSFMYKVVPMSKEEIENHPDNQQPTLTKEQDDDIEQLAEKDYLKSKIYGRMQYLKYLCLNTAIDEVLSTEYESGKSRSYIDNILSILKSAKEKAEQLNK